MKFCLKKSKYVTETGHLTRDGKQKKKEFHNFSGIMHTNSN